MFGINCIHVKEETVASNYVSAYNETKSTNLFDVSFLKGNN